LANVLAVHKLTGIIAEVPEEYLDIYPELTKATEKQLKAARDQAETAIYGAPLKNGIIPGDLAHAPQSEVGEHIVNTEGAASNG
jgi:hypothetical protein